MCACEVKKIGHSPIRQVQTKYDVQCNNKLITNNNFIR